MADGRGLWVKIGDEVRAVSHRARHGARRAVRDGVLRVDLLGLRRDRRSALADLGERTLALWKAGRVDATESDPETIRIRSRIEAIEESIRTKRDELARLRAQSTAPPPADLDWSTLDSPGARGTNGG